MKKKLTAFLIIAAFICGLLPVKVFATLNDLGLARYNNGLELYVGERVTIDPSGAARYNFSITETDIVRFSSSSIETAIYATSVTIMGHSAGSSTLTISNENGSIAGTINITVLKRLTIQRNTSFSLTRSTNNRDTLPLSFIFDGGPDPQTDGSYTSKEMFDGGLLRAWSDDETIVMATINENNGQLIIETLDKTGTTQIHVDANAPDYDIHPAELTLSIVVQANQSDTPAPPPTTPAAPAAPPVEPQYSTTKFTAAITIGGAKFYTSNDFSAGTAFAIRPENDGGDWWRSPAAFKGARGVYTANEAGVFELSYCDPEGNLFSFMVNTHRRVLKNRFMVPERVPVGALFAIKAPEGVGVGIWGKESAFLNGNNGTYVPLKAGKTFLTFTTVKYRYTLYLDIVDDTLPPESTPGEEAGATPPEAPPPADAPPAQPPADVGLTLQSIVPRGSIVLH
jgi:hypothetical protein